MGDIPAQGKREFYDFDRAIDKAEKVINRDLGIYVLLDAGEQDRLKIADTLELLWFSVEEVERGNKNFMGVCSRCLGYLDQLPLDPKVSEMREQLIERIY